MFGRTDGEDWNGHTLTCDSPVALVVVVMLVVVMVMASGAVSIPRWWWWGLRMQTRNYDGDGNFGAGPSTAAEVVVGSFVAGMGAPGLSGLITLRRR